MELTGNTSVLPLFDLVQMLSVNEATGLLKVENGQEKGYLYFQEGAVINALDGEHREGEEAAKRVFALVDADFSFASELPSVAHRIRSTAQNLMMEVARQLDEESVGEGGEPKHGERVREVQQASEALNEIFQQLDADSKILSLRSHQGFAITDLLGSLEDCPTAVLHIREGTPPETRRGDRMAPLAKKRVDRRGYQELRDLLLRGATPLGPVGGDSDAFLLSAGSHGRFRIERVRWPGGELLTARRAPTDTELTEALPWTAEVLDELIAPPGAVILMTAAEYPDLTRLFDGACAHVLGCDLGPFVGIARRWNSPMPRAGAVLLSTLRPAEMGQAGAVVDRVSPAIVAVEDSDCRPALRAGLRALRTGSRALLGVCAPSPSHVAHRFFDGVPTDERRSWAYHLGAGLGAVLAADGTALAVSDPVRNALLAGDVAPFAAALAGDAD